MDFEREAITMTTVKSIASRPLVTFALFAYNQETYIREAVMGAFSQTYEPLQIILSDDCSSDRTYQIMQEMSAAYDGPHQVRVRQSSKNFGTLAHVLKVAAECSGEYIVLAAGDDISSDTRTTRLIEYIQNEDLDMVSSEALQFSQNSKYRTYLGRTGYSKYRYEYIFDTELRRIHGATAAYRKRDLLNVKFPSEKLFLEDTFFELFAHLRGIKVGFLQEPLVFYRLHDENTTSKVANLPIEDLERNLNWAKLEHVKIINHICDHARGQDSLTIGQTEKLVERAKIKISYLSKRSQWYDLSVKDRIYLMLSCKGLESPYGLAARLLGLRVYTFLNKMRFLFIG